MKDWQTLAMGGGALFLVFMLLVSVIVFVKYFNLWLQAFVTRARVSMLSLIAMSFRKVNARAIVESKITKSSWSSL